MKHLIVGLNILFVISTSFGQNINVSKDTLMYLLKNNPHPYDIYDSLFVYNTDSTPLTIDSILTKKNFYYRLFFKYNEIVEKMDYIGHYSAMFPLVIPPKDSAKFIFEFIVPVTKISHVNEMWSDSLFVYNNSKNIPVLIISAFNDIPLDANDDRTVPVECALYQNYPNPFNPKTVINYSLQKASFISLEVFDALGKTVGYLFKGYMNAGKHELIFDGESFSSGVYYYQLRVGKNIITKKMSLIK